MDSTSYQKLKPAKLFSTCYCPPDTDYENRSPIILIHGAGATSGTWKGVREKIGKETKRKVICIDLRNHGKSEWPDTISLDHMVVDLENFMLEQKIPKAILLGHSFGGRGALGLAFERPDLVDKLILADTYLHQSAVVAEVQCKMLTVADTIKRLPKTLSEAEAHKLVMKYFETLFPEKKKYFQDKQSLLLSLHKDKKTGTFKCSYDLEALSKLENYEFDLSTNPSYSGKALIMLAEKSWICDKKDLEELRILLPNSKEVCLVGTTHSLHLENPKKFIEFTSEFINED